MSSAHGRSQFRTNLKCSRCGADGHAIWEENSQVNSSGPMGELISLSENFFHKANLKRGGIPLIACGSCGTAQPD